MAAASSPDGRPVGLVLRDVIGEGGSGTVYAASRDGRELAVKVLREDVARSAREQQRFVDEAERMRRVKHRGLVLLVESGVLPDGRPFIAMPRLYGETLAARLTRGALSLERALAMFEVLAGAVHALHEAGLVHRDIKPENIFLEVDRAALGGAVTGRVAVKEGDRVDGFCHPVLLDLGIAQEAERGASTTTLSGHTRGTPAYMAPERFFGASATMRSDVYELAVTLYAMLTGHLPWRESQSTERLAPIDPIERGVSLPEGLTRVMLGALSTRPEARPSSVRDFAVSVAEGATSTTFDHRTTAPIATSFREASEITGAPASARRASRVGSLRIVAALLTSLFVALAVFAMRSRRPSVAAPVPTAEATVTPPPPPEAPPTSAASPASAAVPLPAVTPSSTPPRALPATPQAPSPSIVRTARPPQTHATAAPSASVKVDVYDHM